MAVFAGPRYADAEKIAREPGHAGDVKQPALSGWHAPPAGGRSIEEAYVQQLLVMDRGTSRDLIRERKKRGLDRYDEVWDGVLPLAFRKITVRGKPRTEIRRTDGIAGRWVV